MALHYILDGYNIIKQVPSLTLRSLRGSREKLVKLIEDKRPQGSLNNKVTVIYDGKPGIVYQHDSKVANIIYSDNESADDTIRRVVSRSKRQKETIVVTDDKELQFSVRALGAKILPVKSFLLQAGIESSTGARINIKKAKHQEAKRISKSLEYAITDELKKIWLKDSKGK